MIAVADAEAVLAELVGFPSVSGRSNLPIAGAIADRLSSLGASVAYDRHSDGERVNLFATVGPEVDGGVILSGHMDVVPADPAGWESDPFVLDVRGHRLVGRGAVDMKGFLAIALAAAPAMVEAADAGRLRRPIHFAFTFDEETGSFGAAHMEPFLRDLPFRPSAAIVGEPTNMVPFIGHKGGYELTTQFRGRAGHASRPSRGLNTISYAARFVSFLDQLALQLQSRRDENSLFEPPYTTINVGRIVGGEAGNVIPDTCTIDWEFRPVPGDDGQDILATAKAFLFDTLLVEMREAWADADIRFLQEVFYPPLAVETPSQALQLVQRVWPDAGDGTVVSFGTDGCYIQRAGISTVVFGPGDLARAHLPNEFITRGELAQGLNFMDRLLTHLCS